MLKELLYTGNTRERKYSQNKYKVNSNSVIYNTDYLKCKWIKYFSQKTKPEWIKNQDSLPTRDPLQK